MTCEQPRFLRLTRRQTRKQLGTSSTTWVFHRETPRYARKLRRGLLRHTTNLFAAEPKGKLFRSTLDQRLNQRDLSLREVLEGATAVLYPGTLDAAPGVAHTTAELRANRGVQWSKKMFRHLYSRKHPTCASYIAA